MTNVYVYIYLRNTVKCVESLNSMHTSRPEAKQKIIKIKL